MTAKKTLSSFVDKNGGSKMKEVVVGDGDNKHDATKGRVKRKLPETAYPQKVAPVKKPLLQEHSTAEKNASDISEEVTSSRTLRQPHTSPNYVCSRNQSFLAGRRKPLRWTVEEETTLKEGVLKFSTKNEKVPWKRILEFGSRVFDKTRTPIDLKDKWRNITAKEGL